MKDYKIEVRVKNKDYIYDMQEATMNTVNKTVAEAKEMTPELFCDYILSEHSPIRSINLRVKMMNIKYVNSVHFVRHGHFIEHYVTTNRPDRTKKERSIDDRVNHIMDCNPQSLIDMTRKRLCKGKCDEETHEIMLAIKKALLEHEDENLRELSFYLVPNCVYRAGCPEFKSCGFYNEGDTDIRYEDYNYEVGLCK